MAQSIKLGNNVFLDVAGIDGVVKQTLTGNADIDALITSHDSGVYYCSNTSTTPAAYGMLVLMSAGAGSGAAYHVFISSTANAIYVRYRSNNTWGSWYKFSGTVVS